MLSGSTFVCVSRSLITILVRIDIVLLVIEII